MVGQSGTNTSSSKVAILLVRARIPIVKEIPPAVQTKPPDSRRNGIVAVFSGGGERREATPGQEQRPHHHVGNDKVYYALTGS